MILSIYSLYLKQLLEGLILDNIEIVFFKDKNTDENIKEFLNLISKTGAEVNYLKDERGEDCYVFEVKESKKRSPGRPVKEFKEVELTVLKALLKENLNVEEISKQMRKSKRAVEYNVRLLEANA